MFADFFGTTYSDAQYDESTYSFTIPQSESVLFPPISTSDILYSLTNFKSSFSCGPDGVPSCLLINCAHALSVPLSILFNTSLKWGYFPNLWKESFIIPLFKSGSKSNITNYRGIAKLSAIPKLFEKCITGSLCHQVSSILSPYQHGFRKGYSTTSNLLQLSTLVNQGFVNGKHTDVIYTDFSKAFDKVNHLLLLKKLSVMGFTNTCVNWIKSYLTGRQQRVCFNTTLSKYIIVKSGVPQGSHLCPILFTLFINDLQTSIKFSKLLMYADDVKIFQICKDSDDHSLLQQDLDSFFVWCSINLMELNLKKCKHMHFSRKLDEYHPFYFNGYRLEPVESILDLGILLDSKLKFIQHITMSC